MLKAFENPICVTRPFLPPLDRFCESLKDIWDSGLLTNNGPVLQRFRRKLTEFLETESMSLFNNGTLALQIGLQALGITGEVITTPFTFVATSHALHWNGIRPVFVDIESEYYTLDPANAERAITPRTTAILAVHVYGHPCNIDALADIARRHRLRLIYDAAHAFGVKVDGAPIGRFGDVSMFSFHATKLFHSLEGGMLTYSDPALGSTLEYLKNFGFQNEVEVVMRGTNAKMNELQALMGEMVLQHLPEIIDTRRSIYHRYQERLSQVPGIKLVPALPPGVDYNYAHMSIEVHQPEFGMSRDSLYDTLKQYNVFTRRYFYPLICDFVCYRNISLTDPLTVARTVADRILTLPIFYDLALADVDRICDLIVEIQRDSSRTPPSLPQSGFRHSDPSLRLPLVT